VNEPWNARRILTDLATPELRTTILTEFWKAGDAQAKALATAHLAKSMRFRTETIKKATPGKKGEWLASRIAAPELEQALEIALMAYHTKHARELMGAFLDEWKIPHEDGSIEVDDYEAPTAEMVIAAIEALRSRFTIDAMRLYLASAGLIMGAGEAKWRDATWAGVDAAQA